MSGRRATGGGGRLASRPAWMALGLIVVVGLVVGSYHPRPTTTADRIRYLESVIKCPVCEDVSIGASNAQQAANLRAKVVALVDEGASNAAVESYVVAQFGPGELLRPTNVWIWVVPIAALIVGAAGLTTLVVRRRRELSWSTSSLDDEALVALARKAAP